MAAYKYSCPWQSSLAHREAARQRVDREPGRLHPLPGHRVGGEFGSPLPLLSLPVTRSPAPILEEQSFQKSRDERFPWCQRRSC